MFCSYCLPTHTFPPVRRIGTQGTQKAKAICRAQMSPETYRIHKTPLEDNETSNDCLAELPQSFRDAWDFDDAAGTDLPKLL